MRLVVQGFNLCHQPILFKLQLPSQEGEGEKRNAVVAKEK